MCCWKSSAAGVRQTSSHAATLSSADASVMVWMATLVLASVTTPLVIPEPDVDDALILSPGDPSQPDLVHVVFTNASRLVIDTSSVVRHVSILNAPRVREIEGTADLQVLLVGDCLLERLEDPLARLTGVRILKLVRCQLKGTLELALLFATPALVTLSLEGNQFDKVVLSQHPEQPSLLEQLDLSGNALEHLNWSVLEPFTKLSELELSRNRLISLTGAVRLPSLRVLSLRKNWLIQADLTGCDCAALDQVFFARNKMTDWPTFATSSTAVRILELSTNLLSSVNYTGLGQHRSLVSLLLNENAISSLESSEEYADNETTLELPHLYSLFLDENLLEVVQLDRWNLPMLQSLSVKFNPLKSLSSNLFLRLPKLHIFNCYCSEIDCEWFEQNRSLLERRIVHMSTQRSAESTNDPSEQCVAVQYLGCVLCSARS